jgi:hypothetical protein
MKYLDGEVGREAILDLKTDQIILVPSVSLDLLPYLFTVAYLLTTISKFQLKKKFPYCKYWFTSTILQTYLLHCGALIFILIFFLP